MKWVKWVVVVVVVVPMRRTLHLLLDDLLAPTLQIHCRWFGAPTHALEQRADLFKFL